MIRPDDCEVITQVRVQFDDYYRKQIAKCERNDPTLRHSLAAFYPFMLSRSRIPCHTWELWLNVCVWCVFVCVSGPMRLKCAFFTLIGCSCRRLRRRRSLRSLILYPEHISGDIQSKVNIRKTFIHRWRATIKVYDLVILWFYPSAAKQLAIIFYIIYYNFY